MQKASLFDFYKANVNPLKLLFIKVKPYSKIYIILIFMEVLSLTKNKQILTLLIGIIIILLVICLFLFFPKENIVDENKINSENLIVTNKEEIVPTEIKKDVISEELANKKIIDIDRINSEIEFEFKDGIKLEVESIADFDNIWENKLLLDSTHATLYDITWIKQTILNPLSHRRNAFKLTLPIYFNSDPNEKKENLLFIVDSFIKENDNILYYSEYDVKNILDIPSNGLYILAEKDTHYYSLRIIKPEANSNYFYCYITAITKMNQIVKNSDAWINKEVESIQSITKSLNIPCNLDIVLRVGTEYIKEFDGAEFKLEDEDLTPEQKSLLISMGLY